MNISSIKEFFTRERRGPFQVLLDRRFAAYREEKGAERDKLKAKGKRPLRALKFMLNIQFQLYPDGRVTAYPFGDGVEHTVTDEKLKQLVYAAYNAMAEEAKARARRK